MTERHNQIISELPVRELLPGEKALEALIKGEIEPALSIEEAVCNAQELLKADLKEIQKRLPVSGVYVHGRYHFHNKKE